MTLNAQDASEVEDQIALLRARLGTVGSGAVRYAAAMFFYNADLMSCEMLEMYRRCSKFDSEDPVELAIFEGVSLPRFLMPVSA